MRILIDICHPAHVHLFINFVKEMEGRNNKLLITVRDIPSAIELLDIHGIPYINLGSKSDSIKGKAFKQLYYDWLLYRLVKRNSIDIALGTSITIAHVSMVTHVKSFVFDDDDSKVEPLFAKFGHPFADYLISPDCLAFERNKNKHITYAGYHELAYLHPNRFQPDPKMLEGIGLRQSERFFVLRFNVFKAHHDLGVKGLSLEQKRKLITLLAEKGKVFITTERDIDPEFSKYQVKLSPEKIHHLLYYATMFIGDSQTMTSEAAVLGTPAIRCNSFVGKISYLEEEEHKYGLTYGFTPDKGDEMIRKIDELLNMPNIKEEWENRRQKMLAEKIDVTAFMVWLIENYPHSVEIIKRDPEYQFRFR